MKVTHEEKEQGIVMDDLLISGRVCFMSIERLISERVRPT